jgi:oxygen-independent coproporphyrinogen-3 oxidase
MCYKEALKNDSDLDLYIGYLARDMDLKLEYMDSFTGQDTTHMHWGGGTPTLLSLKQLETIHKKITDRLKFETNGQGERSIEAFPDNQIITRKKLELLKVLGFNVISFGIQDFDQRIQKVINREHDPVKVRELIEMAKEIGFRVHVDLCYGLPFQGINELERTIKEVLPAAPSRICIFPYAHAPLIFPRQNIIPRSSIPSSFIKVLMAEQADRLLTNYGYIRLGLDHYLRADDPFLNDLQINGSKTLMGYSQNDKANYLGFGATAISFFDRTFYRNVSSLRAYYKMLDENQLPVELHRSYRHNDDDHLRNKLIQDYILTRFEIDFDKFEQEFDIVFNDYFQREREELNQYEKDGLVDFSDPTTMRITQKGQFFSRHIAHLFDRFYKQQSS